MRRLFKGLSGAVALLALTSGTLAHACQSTFVENAAALTLEADIIIVGQVIDYEIVDERFDLLTYRVDEVLKGEAPPEITIYEWSWGGRRPGQPFYEQEIAGILDPLPDNRSFQQRFLDGLKRPSDAYILSHHLPVVYPCDSQLVLPASEEGIA